MDLTVPNADKGEKVQKFQKFCRRHMCRFPKDKDKSKARVDAVRVQFMKVGRAG